MKTFNIDGQEITIFNATPHPINFEVNGEVETVEQDVVISATPTEEVVSVNGAITFVRTVFKPTEEGVETVHAAMMSGANIVVGSIISAQAYPGRVFSMIPMPGFERVPPARKRMNPRKFNTF